MINDVLKAGEFELLIQPIKEVSSFRTVGGEVLSRLNHDTEGTIFPASFLKAVDAEHKHLEFDMLIFRKSCAALRAILDDNRKLGFLSVNFSRRTLSHESLVSLLCKAADAAELPHSRLAVEITEYDEPVNRAQFVENIRQLKAQGFLVFVDDLGNGFTSARDLVDYPADIIKLSRDLLVAAKKDETQACLQNLVALASRYGGQVLCEGIEKFDELEVARNAGCHYGQGVLLSPPLPVQQFADSLEKV